ncbi:hypothetical protein ACT4UT_07590, partial [Bacillus sp. B-TM1]
MRFDEAYSGKVFIKSHPSFEESKVVIYGMPMDWTVSYRPGSSGNLSASKSFDTYSSIMSKLRCAFP